MQQENLGKIPETPYLICLTRTFRAWFAFTERPAQLGFEAFDEA